MFFIKELASFALPALLFCRLSNAVPTFTTSGLRTRDVPDTNATSSTPNVILEPIIPPEVDVTDFSILALDKAVTLAWAGSPDSSNSRRSLKRDTGILSQANMTFRYPVVPLDQSVYVSGVSCSSGTLKATLTSDAYTYAKKAWKGAARIVFVTAADGCGSDHANDMFLTTSISFSDSDFSFSAAGSSASYKDVAVKMNLQWGDVGTHNLRRAVDKRSMFESQSLRKRVGVDATIEWSAYLHDLLGEDEDAPWEGAALLASWGKEDGEEDDSWKKGEVAEADGHYKMKRSNITDLDKRELDYGLKLYCVECGFGGSATIWGEVDADILPPGVNKVQAGFGAQFQAGLYLGMEAYVKYEKEWEKELAKIMVGGFEIPLLAEVGPFVSVGIEAKASIAATGSLLIGAGVEYRNIDIMLDLLDSGNSHANGLTPIFDNKIEASGELKMEASLGLPVKIGIGIEILEGFWEAEAAVVDTPSVNLEGSFEVSAEVTDEGEIEYDINGGCYGIAWNVHFENSLEAEINVDLIGSLSVELIEPWESDPIFEGCIGYVNDGTHDDSHPQGNGAATGQTGNGLNTGGNGLGGGRGGRP